MPSDYAMPFSDFLGVELIEVTPERVVARMKVRPELCTRPAVLHGGAVMALADTLGGVATVANLAAGQWTTTIESKTNFLRAVRNGYAEAVSRPLHAGRTVVVVETDVTDSDGRPVAKILQTQAVLRSG